MNVRINLSFTGNFVSGTAFSAISEKAAQAFKQVKNKSGKGNDFLGWVDLPKDYDKDEFVRIQKAAEKIKNSCDIFIVLGIGGSYLGARAAIEFVKSPFYNQLKKDTPDIYFAGNSISPSAMSELLSICEGRELCINVISKSGTTTETAVAFRVFRKYLIDKYGEEGARERIFVTTDRERGTLKQTAVRERYESFVIPDDVGGRYSVLTAVGLLPIAVSGISISDMMRGAQDARNTFSSEKAEHNEALKYAVVRSLLYQSGKKVEMMVGYEPYLQMFSEWWKQLFGESEGKEHKGLLPHSVIYTTDLHSMGQYLQEGERLMFETVLDVKSDNDFFVPEDRMAADGLDYLQGKELSYINRTAMLGTLLAHLDGGVPSLVLEVSERSAYSFGYLVYFFELACACSGYMLGVNPFNQPGVESYKKNMFALLGKPGYEKNGEELRKRIH